MTSSRTAPLDVTHLDTAALVVSIDVEMAWGIIHRPESVYDFPDERAQMQRLLDMFDEYEVPATWAFVGHLMLDGCARTDGIAHPELVRPSYSWFDGDWLAADPCSTSDEAPKWYAPDLLEAVRARPVGHEIGSHSFTHLIAGDPGCSEDAFRSDLARCREVAAQRGTPVTSFIFPRNRYGHEAVLGEEGFRCFRGPRPDPFAGRSGPARRLGQLVDTARPGAASVVRPIREAEIWNLPATYLHDVGNPRRYALRVAQARRRLRQAVAHRGLFHVWFHPHNAQHETERWFDGLDRLLADAAKERAAGRLATTTMSQVVDQLEARSADAEHSPAVERHP